MAAATAASRCASTSASLAATASRSFRADRDGHAPTLIDVRRFSADWEKQASVRLRAGDPTAIDTYASHGRIIDGERDEILDAAYQAWRTDIEAGRTSLMIAPDAATVTELNRRARADLVTAGQVEAGGVEVADGSIAGIGDQIVTSQNDRTLTAGRRWVRNGDHWTVTAIADNGSITARSHNAPSVVLPSDYVAHHVELAYAATAHRAQGRTTDTAHAVVWPTTTREVLYVSSTRGRHANRLYVDTRYDPDPSTGHDTALQPQTAREVLIGVLGRQGADVSAHEALHRAHDQAESIATLAGEYQTIAGAAQKVNLPRAQPTADLDLARGLHEREHAIETRATTRAEQAAASLAPWIGRLGRPPTNPMARSQWLQAVTVVAAYRDRWDIKDHPHPLGPETTTSTEQAQQRQRAFAAARRAFTTSRTPVPATSAPQIEQRGIEL